MALACSKKLLQSASEVRECGWTIRITRMLRGDVGRNAEHRKESPRGDAMGQAVDIHRLHFAFTITFHYIFPQLTMGLALLLVYLKTKALRTGNEHYNRAARFWGRIFGINFAVGVFSFFLESSFLGLFLFGEKKLGRIGHWLSAFLVFLGSWLSGYFIVATDA